MAELGISVERVDGHTVVALDGTLDVVTAGRVRDHLDHLVAEGRADIILDVARVRFIDSAGLGMLIGARRRVVAAGGRLALRGPNDRMQRLLATGNIGSLFPAG